MQPYGDPGWLPALKYLLPFAASRSDRANGLILLRGVFLALLNAALLILLVMTFIFDDVGSPDALVAAVLLALGLTGVAAAAWTRNRPLDATSASHAAGAYRSSFFLGFALNEIPLLISFVVCFQVDELWPYLTTLPLYLIGMALVAPGRRNLDRREEQLRRQGSSISLRRELSEPPTVR